MFRVRKIQPQPGDDLLVNMPRNRSIAQLREYINKEWNISISDQKLYYQGKELVDGHQIIEYNIKRNDIIQLMIKPKLNTEISLKTETEAPGKSDNIPEMNVDRDTLLEGQSKYYKIGDPVDLRMKAEDGWVGAWFESEIVGISQNADEPTDDDENVTFLCKVLRYDYMLPFKVKFNDIRPRSHHVYNFGELEEGMVVLANINLDDPKKRGLWYDFKIKKLSKKSVEGVVFLNPDLSPVESTLPYLDECMKIETPCLLTERKENLPCPPHRKYPSDCKSCLDNRRRDCKLCGCHKCGKKDRPELLLLCDECDMAFHISCLDPPLEEIPTDDEWFCPGCKNDDEIVKAGESLKDSSKRAKKPSAKKETGRDWDNGMACAGRTRECTIVPKNHFGPVPGVDVGTVWKFRTQVSEAGIHRPIVAGIHGRSDEGAYSIVVSGGYEDDVDNGEEFEYTGAGGRDLSGNKRVSGQSCDQELTQTNKALALNCKAKFNDVKGAESDDWKAGKPVRVVRKAHKSKYAPEEGYRYDGIYKIVKYYPEKGKSGFRVWKYVLRRDDPNPSPWTENAPVFKIIYPPDHLEAEAAKKMKREEKAAASKRAKSPNKQKAIKNDTSNGVKRRQPSLFEMQGISKKPKIENKFTLTTECEELIKSDEKNEKLWEGCKAVINNGKKAFLDKVEEVFMCICCQELLDAPITLICGHSVCKLCLTRSFKADIYCCPTCRNELGKQYKMDVNSALSDILKILFPGYNKGR